MNMKKIFTGILIIIIVTGAAWFGYKKYHKTTQTTPVVSAQTAKQTQAMSNSLIVLVRSDPTVGPYLTDVKGSTLYTYGNDKSGVSNCSGSCLTTWPAYQSAKDTSTVTNVTVIKNADGTLQYAYKGQPLYLFVTDTKPGQITGNNVANFHVAKP